MKPECAAIAKEIETKTDHKDKYEAMACLDECMIKSIGGMEDDGNLKKDVILAYMNDKLKDYPDLLASSKNVSELCFEKG